MNNQTEKGHAKQQHQQQQKEHHTESQHQKLEPSRKLQKIKES